MKKWLAAGVAALGLALVATDYADAATRGGFGGGGFRGGGGGFRGGFGGGGFRGGFGGFRGGFGGFRGGFGGFRGGFRSGIFIGPTFGFGFYDPFWWPAWSYPWSYPWAYPYPVATVAQYAPPAGYAGYGVASQQYWYRCGNPEGYYPYVHNCNTGWEQVPVAPPNPAGPPAAPPPPR
jgi:hypothetical protein